jgi:hypothetical protein
MTGKKCQFPRVRGAKTIWGSRFEPVATVHVQKSGIKYKKPALQDLARDDLPLRNAGREGVTRARRSQGAWWSRGRTPRLALGVGGRISPGRSARADRPLFHSQIFFPQLNVFSALPRWKSSRAFDCKHLRRAGECQHIANEGRSAVQAGIGFIGSHDAVESDPGMVDLFSGGRYGGGRSNFRRQGIGPVGSWLIFLRKIPELIFLRPLRRKADRRDRGEKR